MLAFLAEEGEGMEQNTLVFITKSLYTVFSKKQIHDMTVFLNSDSRPIPPSKEKGLFCTLL